MKLFDKRIVNIGVIAAALFFICGAVLGLMGSGKQEDRLVKWTVRYPETYRIVDSVYSCRTGVDTSVTLEFSYIDSKGDNVTIAMEKTVDKTPDMIELEPAKVREFSIKEGFYDGRGHN